MNYPTTTEISTLSLHDALPISSRRLASVKKQHAAAIEVSAVQPFVLYTLRHTCLTRWAKYMDPFTLHVLAGHTDMNTTDRKSTRLNSSHQIISYAVFCLKKKK